MEYSSAWLCYRQAEDNYFTCRGEFMQNEEKMVNDLKKALTEAGNKETAMRLLLDEQPNVALMTPLLPAIIDIAVDSTGLTGIGLARVLLRKYKNELQIRENVSLIVATYLAENDEWHYRRITELYEVLGYEEELASFLLLCQVNANPEIQEIADDAGLKK
jgi:hypothetical protein